MCTIVAGINAWFLACPGEPRKAGFGDASKFGVSKFEEKSACPDCASGQAEVPTAWGGVVGRSAVGKGSAATHGPGVGFSVAASVSAVDRTDLEKESHAEGLCGPLAWQSPSGRVSCSMATAKIGRAHV